MRVRRVFKFIKTRSHLFHDEIFVGCRLFFVTTAGSYHYFPVFIAVSYTFLHYSAQRFESEIECYPWGSVVHERVVDEFLFLVDATCVLIKYME